MSQQPLPKGCEVAPEAVALRPVTTNRKGGVEAIDCRPTRH